MPIQGEITDDLAEALSQEVLREIHRAARTAWCSTSRACGSWTATSAPCSRTSPRPRGSWARPPSSSGLSPEIAPTLQTMGVELEAVRTALSLEQALTMLGLEVNEAGEERAEDEDDSGTVGHRPRPASATNLASGGTDPREHGPKRTTHMDSTDNEDKVAEVYDKIADVLMLAPTSPPETSPAASTSTCPRRTRSAPLSAGVNEMIDSLAAEQQKSADFHRRDLEDKLGHHRAQRPLSASYPPRSWRCGTASSASPSSASWTRAAAPT